MTNSVNFSEYALEAGKVTPPTVVMGISLFGVRLEDWALILTIIYTLLMSASLIMKFLKDRRDSG